MKSHMRLWAATGTAALGLVCFTPHMALAADAAPSALEAPVAASALPAKDSKAASRAALWQELEKNPYIPEGASDKDAKGMFYAFFDPNCIFCHLAWKLSQPYLKQGLQVRWIPVAFVMPDSAAKASWLLTSKDPSAALHQGESGWKKGVRDGGGAFLDGPVMPDVQAQLKANEKLFTDFGFDATPSFVYKDKAGHVQTMPGIPNQHMITLMTGLPFIPTTDPDLEHIPR